jgi:DNA-binding response OmpR family regulator
VLRHVAYTTQGPATPVFTVGQLQVDLARRYVSVAAQPVHLTPIEYKLLPHSCTTLVKW